MSQSNEKQQPLSNSNRMRVNEQGELIINDPELANAVQELSDEDLDAIAGGAGANNCDCTIINPQ